MIKIFYFFRKSLKSNLLPLIVNHSPSAPHSLSGSVLVPFLGAVSGRQERTGQSTNGEAKMAAKEQQLEASAQLRFYFWFKKLFRFCIFLASRSAGIRGCGCPDRILFFLFVPFCFRIKRRAIKFNVWTNRKWRLHLNNTPIFGKDVRNVRIFFLFFCPPSIKLM